MKMTKRETSLWQPFDILSDLQDEMNRVFSRSLTGREHWLESFRPTIDVNEEADKYVLKADLPGLKKEDFNLSVEGRHLILKGERKQEKETKTKDTYYSERFFGSFQRSIELPTEVDAEKVKASYKDGVLEAILPKAPSAKSKQIPVEG